MPMKDSQRPEQMIIPQPGSPRYEVNPTFWAPVLTIPCLVCGQSLGSGTWALRWEAHRWAHLHCWDDLLAAERAIGDNPWLSEESAKRHNLTIAQFRALPFYERIKMNQVSKDLR